MHILDGSLAPIFKSSIFFQGRGVFFLYDRGVLLLLLLVLFSMKAISDQVQKLTASSLSLVLISPSPNPILVCVIENKGEINQLFLLI